MSDGSICTKELGLLQALKLQSQSPVRQEHGTLRHNYLEIRIFLALIPRLQFDERIIPLVYYLSKLLSILLRSSGPQEVSCQLTAAFCQPLAFLIYQLAEFVYHCLI